MTDAQLVAYAWAGAVLLMGVIALGIYFITRKFKFRADATDKETGKKMFRLIIADLGELRYTWGVPEGLGIREQVGKKEKRTGEFFSNINLGKTTTWYPEGGTFASQGLNVPAAIYISGKPDSLVRNDWDAPRTNVTYRMGMLRNERFQAVETNALEAAHETQAEIVKPKMGAAAIVGIVVGIFAIGGIGYGIWLLLSEVGIIRQGLGV